MGNPASGQGRIAANIHSCLREPSLLTMSAMLEENDRKEIAVDSIEYLAESSAFSRRTGGPVRNDMQIAPYDTSGQ